MTEADPFNFQRTPALHHGRDRSEVVCDGGVAPPSRSVDIRSGSDRLEHRLPTSFIDYYQLEKGDPIRVSFDRFGSHWGFRLRRTAFDSAFSNERRLIGTSARHLRLRYPSQVTAALGMKSIVKEEGVARLDSIDSQSFRVTFDPAISVWKPPAGELGAASARIEPCTRSLLRLYNKDRPLGIEKYRLDIPRDYRQAYRFERGDEIAIRLGEVNETLGLRLGTTGSAEESPLTRRLQVYHRGDGNEDDTSASPDGRSGSNSSSGSRSARNPSGHFGLHLPKQVVHTLGIDTDLSPADDPRDHPLPKLHIQPGVGHIAATEIRPSECLPKKE